MKRDKKNMKNSKMDISMFEKAHERELRELLANNEFADYFMNLIIKPDLLYSLENHILGRRPWISYERRKAILYTLENGVQVLSYTFIAPIPPTIVNFSPFKKLRSERIAIWANEETLNRVYINYYDGKIIGLVGFPHLCRTRSIERLEDKLYEVGNGNHRFAFAAKNNIPTVLSLVEESFLIPETWVKKMIPKWKKEKQNS